MRSSYPGNIKTLNAKQFGDSREEGNTNNSNHDQEEGTSMAPIVSRYPRNVEPFNATMTVAIGTDGLAVVQPNDDGTVTIAFNEIAAVVTPAVALSLAAAIQSVAVHALEQASEVAA